MPTLTYSQIEAAKFGQFTKGNNIDYCFLNSARTVSDFCEPLNQHYQNFPNKYEKNVMTYTSGQVLKFFAHSDWLDRFVLRPLDHIAPNWEASWNFEQECYALEADSFAGDLNFVIKQIAFAVRPQRYHDHEDILAKETLCKLKWPIQKKGQRWVGADYQSILEQGAFGDIGQQHLITAASGRVHAAMDFGQMHFDEMEDRHLNMLAALMTITIYHRDCCGESIIFTEEGT